jgi:DNA-binding GntR family transcriptional regulator
VTDEELILMLAMTVRIACRRMTPGLLAAVLASAEQAARIPAQSHWDHKAAAHAQLIGLLGEATGDLVLGRLAGLAAAWTYDLAVTAGPGADSVIVGSRRRLLGCLRAGDADAAAAETERHLRGLSRMGTLAGGPGARNKLPAA